MSGDTDDFDTCDKCELSLSDCQCETLEERLSCIESDINTLEIKVSTPDFINFIYKLNSINSKLNELFEKLEDNARRLNNMMLEMKGMISIIRGNIKKE